MSCSFRCGRWPRCSSIARWSERGIADWLLVALFLAAAFWTKYTVVVFVLPLLLFVLMDETARRCIAHARALRRGGAVLSC